MFNRDTLDEIIKWVPKITALACVNRWLYARLRDHPEMAFWREYVSHVDIYAHGIPKYLELAGTTSAAVQLTWSAQCGNIELVRHLCGIGANPRSNDNCAIKAAAVRGHTEMVRILVSAGADPRAGGDEPIICAAEYGYTEMVQYLVSVGADPRAGGDEPIICAAEFGRTETVKYLVSVGADPCARDNRAVKAAAARGHTETVEYLISVGAVLPRV